MVYNKEYVKFKLIIKILLTSVTKNVMSVISMT